MDKNNLVYYLNQKKVIIITAIVVILISIVLVLIPAQPNSNNPAGTTVPSIKAQQNTDTSNVSVTSFAPNNTVSNRNSFTGFTYTLTYPSDWYLQKSLNSTGGELIIVKPNILPASINYPQFILETIPKTGTYMENKIALLKSLGLKEKEATIQGKPAVELKGTIPFKIVSGEIVKQPIQETNILLTNSNNIYTLKYEYEGSDIDTNQEKNFNEILNSFRLQ